MKRTILSRVVLNECEIRSKEGERKMEKNKKAEIILTVVSVILATILVVLKARAGEFVDAALWGLIALLNLLRLFLKVIPGKK